MNRILLLLIFAVTFSVKAQSTLILEKDFLKLEVFEGQFQHAKGQVFRSELSADVYGCWMKPIFKRIKLDTATSKLMLEGRVVCENQGNKKMDEDDFIFMIGSMKVDTIIPGLKPVIAVTIFQNETITIRDANEFKFTIQITSPDDVLCFTTLKDSETKTSGIKTYYPVDPAHFFEVGKLLNK